MLGNKVETLDKNPATPGKRMLLQLMVVWYVLEKYNANKIGSIVAIEPSSGVVYSSSPNL